MALVLFVALSAPAEAKGKSIKPIRGLVAYPASAEMEKYPVMPGVLTPADVSKMNLHYDTLEVATQFLNWSRKEGRFLLEILPARTVVLADENGVVRYKADCGNRLVESKDCPVCAVQSDTTMSDHLNQTSGFGRDRSDSTVVAGKGLIARFGDWIKSLAVGLWHLIEDWARVLGWSVVLLLLLLLIPLLLYLLYRLIRLGLRRDPYVEEVRTRRAQVATPVVTEDEIPVSGGRDWIHYTHDTHHQIRASGYRNIRFEHSGPADDRVVTLRFR